MPDGGSVCELIRQIGFRAPFTQINPGFWLLLLDAVTRGITE